jgi:hypothetical protein
MSDYAVAQLDEIEEMSDGRCPWQPVRHHFGITAFGVNVWTGHDADDRIINERDRALRAVSHVCEGRFGLRSDPRRARVQELIAQTTSSRLRRLSVM